MMSKGMFEWGWNPCLRMLLAVIDISCRECSSGVAGHLFGGSVG